MSDRKDSDIIRQQMIDLDKYEAALGKKQVEFQKVADSLGIEWREEEARNTAQRKAIMIMIHKRLDERLAAAEAKPPAAPPRRHADLLSEHGGWPLPLPFPNAAMAAPRPIPMSAASCCDA